MRCDTSFSTTSFNERRTGCFLLTIVPVYRDDAQAVALDSEQHESALSATTINEDGQGASERRKPGTPLGSHGPCGSWLPNGVPGSSRLSMSTPMQQERGVNRFHHPPIPFFHGH